MNLFQRSLTMSAKIWHKRGRSPRETSVNKYVHPSVGKFAFPKVVRVKADLFRKLWPNPASGLWPIKNIEVVRIYRLFTWFYLVLLGALVSKHSFQGRVGSNFQLIFPKRTKTRCNLKSQTADREWCELEVQGPFHPFKWKFLEIFSQLEPKGGDGGGGGLVCPFLSLSSSYSCCLRPPPRCECLRHHGGLLHSTFDQESVKALVSNFGRTFSNLNAFHSSITNDRETLYRGFVVALFLEANSGPPRVSQLMKSWTMPMTRTFEKDHRFTPSLQRGSRPGLKWKLFPLEMKCIRAGSEKVQKWRQSREI